MWVGVRLLVVFPGPALKPTVLDRSVVAYLRPFQIGEVLADGLIDLLVVVDPVGARCDEQCERSRESHDGGSPSQIDSPESSHQILGKRRHNAHSQHNAGFQGPELNGRQLITEPLVWGRHQPRGETHQRGDPYDRRDDDGSPGSSDQRSIRGD